MNWRIFFGSALGVLSAFAFSGIPIAWISRGDPKAKNSGVLVSAHPDHSLGNSGGESTRSTEAIEREIKEFLDRNASDEPWILTTLYREWAARELEAAMDGLAKIPADLQYWALKGIVEASASQWDKVLAITPKLPPALRSSFGQLIAKALSVESPNVALSKLNDLANAISSSNEDLANSAAEMHLGFWEGWFIRNGIDGLNAWNESGGTASGLFDEVISRIASMSPRLAAGLFEHRSTGEFNQDLFLHVARILGTEDLKSGWAFYRTASSEQSAVRSWEGFAELMLSFNSGNAGELASIMPEGADPDSMQMVASSWSRYDFSAAQAWLAENDLTFSFDEWDKAGRWMISPAAAEGYLKDLIDRMSDEGTSVATSSIYGASRFLAESGHAENLSGFFDESGDRRAHDAITMGIIASEIDLDPAAAVAKNLELPSSETQKEVMKEAISAWTTEDPASFVDWAKDRGFQNGAYTYLIDGVSEIARNDPNSAAVLLRDLLNDSEINGVENGDLRVPMTAGHIASRLAKVDVVRAAEWATSLGHSEARSEAVFQTAETWALTDPASLSEWLATASDIPDAAIEKLVTSISSDPERGIQWASLLNDERKRRNLVLRQYQDWLLSNPNEARSFVLIDNVAAVDAEFIQAATSHLNQPVR